MKIKITPTIISNSVIVFLSLVCFILAFQFIVPPVSNEKARTLSEGWTYQLRGMSEPEQITLPTTAIKNKSGATVILRRHLPDDYIPGATLLIKTSHQSLEVLVDGVSIYKYGIGPTPPLGLSFGNAWHTVRLPSDYMSKELTMSLHSPHNKYQGFADSVDFGTKSSHFMGIISENFLTAFIGTILFVFGVIANALYFVIYRNTKKSAVVLYLATFSIFSGMWVLSESYLLQFVINAPIVISTITMLSMLLMPLPILYFFKSNYIFGEKPIFKVLITIQRTLAITSVIVHMVHLVDFIYIIPIVQVLFVVVLTVGIFYGFANRHKKVVRTTLIGIIVLLASLVLSAAFYYFTPESNVITTVKWGILFFVSIVGIDAGKHILVMSKNNVMNSALAQLAYNDTLTGLKNRAAFQEHLDNLDKNSEALEKVTIALADLNYLKKINDTYGHKKGDSIIIQCANLLTTTFGKIGTVYRIGGDEFVVIIPEAATAQCNEAFANFKRAVKIYNKTVPTGELLSAAIGIAHFNRAYDKTINDLFNRADSAMYTNKVAIKEKNAATLAANSVSH